MTYFVEFLKNVPGGEGDVRHIGDYETLEEAIKAFGFDADKVRALVSAMMERGGK